MIFRCWQCDYQEGRKRCPKPRKPFYSRDALEAHVEYWHVLRDERKEAAS